MSVDSVILQGSGGRLVIDGIDYERQGSFDIDDANWVATQISIHSGPFAGTVKLSFTTVAAT